MFRFSLRTETQENVRSSFVRYGKCVQYLSYVDEDLAISRLQ